MLRILSVGIDCFSSLVFAVPAIMFLQYVIFKQRNFNRFIAVLVFAIYSLAVFSVVGIPAMSTFHVDFGFNLIPLIDIVNSPVDYIENTILNVILFMPLGFMVPAIWKKFRSVKKMIFMGLAVSISIEILQIFSYRLTDIDDLITNTAGTIAGYYLSKRFSYKLLVEFPDHKEYSIQYEPVIILLVMLMIGIFLKPIVSDGIWNMILYKCTYPCSIILP